MVELKSIYFGIDCATTWYRESLTCGSISLYLVINSDGTCLLDRLFGVSVVAIVVESAVSKTPHNVAQPCAIQKINQYVKHKQKNWRRLYFAQIKRPIQKQSQPEKRRVGFSSFVARVAPFEQVNLLITLMKQFHILKYSTLCLEKKVQQFGSIPSI